MELLMKPFQFRSARKGLGLTQHELAKSLGMGKWGFQSVGKWERGEKPIPYSIQLAVEALVNRSLKMEKSND
jgi:transcriptional regulator with XRE-family HTH domain